MAATLLTVAISWLLAAILLAGAHHKFADVQRFAASLAAYQILPSALAAPAARALIAVELTIASALLVMAPFAQLLAALLLAVYAGAIALNVARGRTHIDCGCGDTPTPISWSAVARNLVLVALATWAAMQTPALWQQGAAALLLSTATAAAGYGLYQSAEALLANRGTHQRLWLGATR